VGGGAPVRFAQIAEIGENVEYFIDRFGKRAGKKFRTGLVPWMLVAQFRSKQLRSVEADPTKVGLVELCANEKTIRKSTCHLRAYVQFSSCQSAHRNLCDEEAGGYWALLGCRNIKQFPHVEHGGG